MIDNYRKRRAVSIIISVILFGYIIFSNTPFSFNDQNAEVKSSTINKNGLLALDELAKLNIKGRAPKTGYSRDKFGSGWLNDEGCDMRNIILYRDLKNAIVNDKCEVISGSLNDPYTGKLIQFTRGQNTSSLVQIDHVVALSDAWQKGAQQLTYEDRIKLANDPLELLAVDGGANQEKGDGDAATWLPPNKGYRCEYVARQVAIKIKYNLWVTKAEYDAMYGILSKCNGQLLPNP